MSDPVILLHWDLDGEFHWAAAKGLKVICVDERSPDDRVYLSTGDVDLDVIKAVATGDFHDIVDAMSAMRPLTPKTLPREQP